MVDRVSCPLKFDRSDVALYEKGKRMQITPEQRQKARDIAAEIYRERYGESRETHFVGEAQKVTLDWCFEIDVDGIPRRVLVHNGLWRWGRMPEAEDLRKVGAPVIHCAQVSSPMNEGRSGIQAAEALIKSGADGVVLWARNKEVYNSIIAEFVKAGYPTAEPLDLPPDWKADKLIVIPVRE
jgi:hypothetical protein